MDVFPNPAKNFIRIIGDPDELMIIEVYDLMGRSLNRAIDVQSSSTERLIDLSNLPNGAYFIRTKSGSYPFQKVP